MAQLAIMAGVMAASYAIDYFAAKNSKVAPIDKGRFDDLRITGSDYGATIPIVIGKMRLAPQIVFHVPIITTTSTTPGQAGGKGSPHAPTPATVNYHYTTSLFMMLCAGGLSRGIRRIWAGTKLIWNLDGSEGFNDFYEAENATTITSSAIVSDTTASGGAGVQFATSSSFVQYSNLYAEQGGSFELAIYYKQTGAANLTVTVNGEAPQTVAITDTASDIGKAVCTVTLDTGAVNIIRVAAASTQTTILDRIGLSSTATPDVDPGAGTGILDPINPFPTDPERPGPYYNYRPAANIYGTTSGTVAVAGNARVRTYPGTSTQEIDSLLTSQLGAAAQAYRNRACFMLEEWEIQDGNTNFNSFFLAEVDEGTRTVDVAVQKLFALVNKPSAELDVTALSGFQFKGCVINSRAEVRGVLDALQIAYNFDFVEVDGKIKAVVRGTGTVTVIPQQDMRAHEYGSSGAKGPVAITRTEERTVPRAVSVNYIDITNNYINGAQQAQRSTGRTEDFDTVSLPIVLSPDEAQAIAARLLYSRHLERKVYEWTTSWKYLSLTPTDVVDLQLSSATHRVRITECQSALPGVIKFKGVQHSASIYNQPRGGAPGSGSEIPLIEIPANSFTVFLDIPALRAEDALPGYYVAVSKRKNGRWDGAVLYHENSSGELERITTFDQNATIGRALTKLPEATGPINSFDYAATLDVGIYDGELESITEATANASSQNMFALGDGDKAEICQFLSATPITTVSPYAACYRLTGLRRFMLGTDYLAGCAVTSLCHWTNKSNVTESSASVLAKSVATTAWDAGATSVETWVAKDEPTVEWQMTEVSNYKLAGVRRTSVTNTAGQDLDFGWYFEPGGKAYTYSLAGVDGYPTTGLISAAVGDRFALRFKKEGSIEYLKNDVSVRVTAAYVNPEETFVADCSIYTNGGAVPAPKLSFTASHDARARSIVNWVNLINCAPRGDGGLIKTSGAVATFDAGASSEELLTEGAGFVEHTVASLTANYLFGLSDADSSVAISDIKYAIALTGSGTAAVYLDGILQVTPAAWVVAAGDRLRVAVEDGVIRFYHNDLIKLTLFATPPYPLRIDTSLATLAVNLGTFTFTRGGHYAGESFVLLDSAVKFRREDAANLNTPLTFRTASFGQDPTTAERRYVCLRGNSVRGLPPVDMTSARDAGGNIFAGWRRRAHTHRNLLSTSSVDDEMFIMEVLGADYSVLRRMQVVIGMAMPTVLLNPAGAAAGTGGKGNNFVGAGGIARAAQIIPATGNFVEAVLQTSPSPHAARAYLGLCRSSQDWTTLNNFNPTTVTNYDYNVMMSYGGSQPQLNVYENGVAQISNVNCTSAPRVRIQLSGSEARFYADYAGPGSIPFYVSRLAVMPPYIAAIYSESATYSSVQNVALTIGPTPGTVYSANQQLQDFGSLQSAVRVRLYQESPGVGRGQAAEFVI